MILICQVLFVNRSTTGSSLRQLVVFLEEIDSVDGEESHVLAECECEVVVLVLLVENYVVSELVSDPSHVGGISHVVKAARHEGGWESVVLEWDKRGLFCAIDLFVLNLAIIIEGSSARLGLLDVVNERTVALATWLVADEDIKALEVVDAHVQVQDLVLDE